jgi:hypothetical protein
MAARTGAREAGAAARAVGGAEREAATAGRTAEAAAETARQPNRLARMTALGLEIGIPAAAHAVAGPIAGEIAAGVMGTGRLAGLLIPRASLARALADSTTANLLVRALRTPATSKAVGTIITELRNRDRSVNFLGKPEEEQP